MAITQRISYMSLCCIHKYDLLTCSPFLKANVECECSIVFTFLLNEKELSLFLYNFANMFWTFTTFFLYMQRLCTHTNEILLMLCLKFIPIHYSQRRNESKWISKLFDRNFFEHKCPENVFRIKQFPIKQKTKQKNYLPINIQSMNKLKNLSRKDIISCIYLKKKKFSVLTLTHYGWCWYTICMKLYVHFICCTCWITLLFVLLFVKVHRPFYYGILCTTMICASFWKS